jgi:hypothetical protein
MAGQPGVHGPLAGGRHRRSTTGGVGAGVRPERLVYLARVQPGRRARVQADARRTAAPSPCPRTALPAPRRRDPCRSPTPSWSAAVP